MLDCCTVADVACFPVADFEPDRCRRRRMLADLLLPLYVAEIYPPVGRYGGERAAEHKVSDIYL
jgi:hypothetical protein